MSTTSKIALVTGATRGIGLETVKQLDWFKAQWRDYLEVVPEVSSARALLGE